MLNKISAIKLETLLKIITVLVITLILAILASTYFLSTSFESERESVERKEEFDQLSNELTSIYDQLTETVYLYVQEGEENYYDSYWEEVEERERREEIVKQLEQLGASEEELALIEESVNRSLGMVATEQEALRLVKEEDDFARARDTIFSDYYNEHRERTMEPIYEFQELINQRATKEVEIASQRADFFLILTTILGVMIFLILLFTFIILHKRITSPIIAAQNFATEIAQGNLKIEELNVDRKDEVGELIICLNKMLNYLKDIVVNPEKRLLKRLV